MKKYLALIMGLLFVLGFTASAFGIDEPVVTDQPTVAKGAKVTLGGELRVRGWYLKNHSGTRRAEGAPKDGVSQSWYDERVRLNLNAEVTKNTSGYVEMETGSSTTGDTNTWGNLNSKQSGTLTLREAWILHKGSGLLGIPAGLKVGHMLLALSEKQFLDHTKFGDDAIVFFMDPVKELHVGLLTTKFSEGSTATASTEDINGYVALATYKVDKSTFGLNYTYVQHTGAFDDFSFQNVGLHAGGSAGPVLYQFEFNKQFGDRKPVGGTNVKWSGMGLLAGVGFKMDPVTIRGQYGYGSGDNDATDDKNKEYQTTLGNDVHFTQIYEYTTRTAAVNQTVSGQTRSTGLANLTYYRLGVDVAPMKELTASVDAFLLKATKANTSAGSKKIGYEYDAKVAYQIDKNLTYSIMVGYFKPGTAWTDGNVGAAISSANPNDKKAITQAMHALTLSF